MSDGAAQNGGAQAATTGEAAAVAGAAVAATAAAAPTAAQAVPTAAQAVPGVAASAAPVAAVPAAAAAAAVPAAVAAAQPAPEADCKPVKKKAHHHDKKESDEEHARATDSDEDQNLSQPADGCVLPQTGAQAAPAQERPSVPRTSDGDGDGDSNGGGSNGLLIGAGVLAAVGVGVLALAGGKGGDKNAPPVANADTGAVAEGASLTGSVATNDSDSNNDPLTYSLTGTAPAGLTLNSNGSYTFDANNAAYNALVAGATQVVTANYSVSDGRGGSANSTLTITVTGTNDAPVAVADTGPASTEGGAAVTGSVATNDSDADTGQTATLAYSLNAPVAGLTLNTNGTYSFNPADPAYNALAAGATQTVVANYTVRDASGGTATSTLTFVVTGTNDTPVAVADTAAGTEGNGNLTGSVATNDTDPDTGAVLTYSLNAPVAGLTLNPNGSYTFNLNDPAYDALNTGQNRVVVANYTVTDGQGATSTSTLTITVNGTTDGPIAVADTAAATEGGAVVTGALATNDNNTGAAGTVTYTLAAPVAGLTLNANGTFSFDPTNAAYNALAAGATQTVVANTIATDAQGRTSASTLTITVTGTNDAPIAVADTNAGVEDTTITGSVATNDSDPDTGAALTYTVVGTAPAGFVLNANGTYTLDTTNAAYQNIRDGVVQNVVINYQVADAQGATATSTLTIAVTGRAEVANLDIDSDNNLNTRQVFDGTATDFNFTDDDDVANTVVINNFGADDILTFDAPFNGTGRVAFANIDFDGDGIANDIAITTNKGGVVSDIILSNAISNADAAGVISTESAAEAAIGANFDNFRTTTQSATPTAASLDVDNDSNTTSIFTLPVAANTGTFAYTDDFTVANNVLVRDFGADDTLTFNTALANVSFASGDFDADGIADDLRITTNNGGVVSDIILTNSVAAGAFVSNEAQAEAAVGNGTDNFLFNGTVAPPPPPPPAGTTGQALEVDNDSNLNTYRNFDASLDGFRFTDDADAANTATITNFGTNDRIVFEAGNTYSFANIDFNQDGVAGDLAITINKNGTVSEVVILNAVDANAFFENDVQAETALNARLGTTSVDYFSFA